MNELIQKIESLIGNTYLYEKQKIFIKKYKILTSQKIMIFTETKTLEFLPSEFEEFINTIVKVEDNFPTPPKKNELFIEKADKLIYHNPVTETLQNSLLEMLGKVKEDPKNIPQAKSVIDISNAFVNLEKLNIKASKFIANN